MTLQNGTEIPAAAADMIAPGQEERMQDDARVTLSVNGEEAVNTTTGGLERAANSVGGREVPDFDAANPDDPYPVPDVIVNDFEPAPDLEALAERLKQEHTSLELRVRGAWIRFAWKQKGGEANGARKLGKCQKLSGVNKYLGRGADYLVWLAADHCAGDEEEGLEPFTYQQVEALLFHELNHIDRKYDSQGGFSWGVRTHDVEMFNDEVAEYGLWRPDLERTADVFRQLELAEVR